MPERQRKRCCQNRRLPFGSLIVAVLGVTAGGCISTVALDRAVIAYDTTVAESVSKQLLLNIARARQNEPMHFTAVSSITATYKLGVSAGIGPAMTGERGGLVLPIFSKNAEENPTIGISPMQGDEFTQRLLTPFTEQKLTLLLRQGYDVDALLRLLGAEVHLDGGSGKERVSSNRPSDKEGYPIYRRVMSHLSTIQDHHALFVEPLHFHQIWTVPESSVTPETFLSAYREFSLTLDPEKHVYRVAKRVNGRVMITNYDPGVLTNEERVLLHERAEEAPANDVLLDIRSGYPGGELPLHGRLRLRSFHEILTFIGRGIEEEPEYDVPPDPRTGPISENPVRSLDIVETRRPPVGADLAVAFKGFYYATRPQSGYQWNRKAFSMLYQLFQMSVSNTAPAGPAITISK